MAATRTASLPRSPRTPIDKAPTPGLSPEPDGASSNIGSNSHGEKPQGALSPSLFNSLQQRASKLKVLLGSLHVSNGNRAHGADHAAHRISAAATAGGIPEGPHHENGTSSGGTGRVEGRKDALAAQASGMLADQAMGTVMQQPASAPAKTAMGSKLEIAPAASAAASAAAAPAGAPSRARAGSWSSGVRPIETGPAWQRAQGQSKAQGCRDPTSPATILRDGAVAKTRSGGEPGGQRQQHRTGAATGMQTNRAGMRRITTDGSKVPPLPQPASHGRSPAGFPLEPRAGSSRTPQGDEAGGHVHGAPSSYGNAPDPSASSGGAMALANAVPLPSTHRPHPPPAPPPQQPFTSYVAAGKPSGRSSDGVAEVPEHTPPPAPPLPPPAQPAQARPSRSPSPSPPPSRQSHSEAGIDTLVLSLPPPPGQNAAPAPPPSKAPMRMQPSPSPDVSHGLRVQPATGTQSAPQLQPEPQHQHQPKREPSVRELLTELSGPQPPLVAIEQLPQPRSQAAEELSAILSQMAAVAAPPPSVYVQPSVTSPGPEPPLTGVSPPVRDGCTGGASANTYTVHRNGLTYGVFGGDAHGSIQSYDGSALTGNSGAPPADSEAALAQALAVARASALAAYLKPEARTYRPRIGFKTTRSGSSSPVANGVFAGVPASAAPFGGLEALPSPRCGASGGSGIESTHSPSRSPQRSSRYEKLLMLQAAGGEPKQRVAGGPGSEFMRRNTALLKKRQAWATSKRKATKESDGSPGSPHRQPAQARRQRAFLAHEVDTAAPPAGRPRSSAQQPQRSIGDLQRWADRREKRLAVLREERDAEERARSDAQLTFKPVIGEKSRRLAKMVRSRASYTPLPNGTSPSRSATPPPRAAAAAAAAGAAAAAANGPSPSGEGAGVGPSRKSQSTVRTRATAADGISAGGASTSTLGLTTSMSLDHADLLKVVRGCRPWHQAPDGPGKSSVAASTAGGSARVGRSKPLSAAAQLAAARNSRARGRYASAGGAYDDPVMGTVAEAINEAAVALQLRPGLARRLAQALHPAHLDRHAHQQPPQSRSSHERLYPHHEPGSARDREQQHPQERPRPQLQDADRPRQRHVQPAASRSPPVPSASVSGQSHRGAHDQAAAACPQRRQRASAEPEDRLQQQQPMHPHSPHRVESREPRPLSADVHSVRQEGALRLGSSAAAGVHSAGELTPVALSAAGSSRNPRRAADVPGSGGSSAGRAVRPGRGSMLMSSSLGFGSDVSGSGGRELGARLRASISNDGGSPYAANSAAFLGAPTSGGNSPVDAAAAGLLNGGLVVRVPQMIRLSLSGPDGQEVRVGTGGYGIASGSGLITGPAAPGGLAIGAFRYGSLASSPTSSYMTLPYDAGSGAMLSPSPALTTPTGSMAGATTAFAPAAVASRTSEAQLTHGNLSMDEPVLVDGSGRLVRRAPHSPRSSSTALDGGNIALPFAPHASTSSWAAVEAGRARSSSGGGIAHGPRCGLRQGDFIAGQGDSVPRPMGRSSAGGAPLPPLPWPSAGPSDGRSLSAHGAESATALAMVTVPVGPSEAVGAAAARSAATPRAALSSQLDSGGMVRGIRFTKILAEQFSHVSLASSSSGAFAASAPASREASMTAVSGGRGSGSRDGSGSPGGGGYKGSLRASCDSLRVEGRSLSAPSAAGWLRASYGGPVNRMEQARSGSYGSRSKTVSFLLEPTQLGAEPLMSEDSTASSSLDGMLTAIVPVAEISHPSADEAAARTLAPSSPTFATTGLVAGSPAAALVVACCAAAAAAGSEEPVRGAAVAAPSGSPRARSGPGAKADDPLAALQALIWRVKHLGDECDALLAANGDLGDGSATAAAGTAAQERTVAAATAAGDAAVPTNGDPRAGVSAQSDGSVVHDDGDVVRDGAVDEGVADGATGADGGGVADASALAGGSGATEVGTAVNGSGAVDDGGITAGGSGGPDGTVTAQDGVAVASDSPVYPAQPGDAVAATDSAAGHSVVPGSAIVVRSGSADVDSAAEATAGPTPLEVLVQRAEQLRAAAMSAAGIELGTSPASTARSTPMHHLRSGPSASPSSTPGSGMKHGALRSALATSVRRSSGSGDAFSPGRGGDGGEAGAGKEFFFPRLSTEATASIKALHLAAFCDWPASATPSVDDEEVHEISLAGGVEQLPASARQAPRRIMSAALASAAEALAAAAAGQPRYSVWSLSDYLAVAGAHSSPSAAVRAAAAAAAAAATAGVGVDASDRSSPAAEPAPSTGGEPDSDKAGGGDGGDSLAALQNLIRQVAHL